MFHLRASALTYLAFLPFNMRILMAECHAKTVSVTATPTQNIITVTMVNNPTMVTIIAIAARLIATTT